jgi:hypothetical protein
LQTLIGLGAVDVVVPGVLPIGCFPLYLTLYPGSSKDGDYDEAGCLRSYNNLSSYHNELLRQAVSGLQSKHGGGVRLMYADFYAQVADMVRSPESYGTYVRTHGHGWRSIGDSKLIDDGSIDWPCVSSVMEHACMQGCNTG